MNGWAVFVGLGSLGFSLEEAKTWIYPNAPRTDLERWEPVDGTRQMI